MTLAHRDKHQQVVQAKDQDHSVKNSKEEILIHSIIKKIVPRPEHNNNIRLLIGFYPEIVGDPVIPRMGQEHNKILVLQRPMIKLKTIAVGLLNKTTKGVRNEKINAINGLVN